MATQETIKSAGGLIDQEDTLLVSGLAVVSVPTLLLAIMLYNNPKTKPLVILPPALWVATLVYTVAR